MRGKRTEFQTGAVRDRITPADAGKTLLSAGSWRKRRDHPRGCGENSVFNVKLQIAVGSPPRMRGKPEVTYNYFGLYRITPADAGKTDKMQ